MRTRREFIEQVGIHGGSAFAAMTALGLLAPARAEAFALDGRAAGTRVVILGAGVAGLCAAYELGKAGYECTVLEARERPGGRVWTVRDGTRHVETDGSAQTAAFPAGAYFNPGPARVPQHHVTMDYYRELGVAIEPFTNVNLNAYYASSTVPELRRVRARAVKAAWYGHTAELLAKAVSHDALDAPLTAEDKAKLLAYLADAGGLDDAHLYRNEDGHGGFRELPAAGAQAGIPDDPLALLPIVRAGFGRVAGFEAEITQQMQMFQPVGGIDALPRAFAGRLGSRVRYGAAVQRIGKTADGVRITYDLGGRPRTIDAAYCICTIPLPVLRTIPSDFSPAFAAAIGRVEYMASTKVGLAFRRRFWEEDDRIFGGISWTSDQTITQIWYPSYGYFSPNGGVLTGAYASGEKGRVLGERSPAEREATALREGAVVHPQYRDGFLSSFSVGWHKTPNNLGAWVRWTDATRKTEYPLLSRPDGPIYLAGEHMSYINAWQAGALESARSVVAQLHRRVRSAA